MEELEGEEDDNIEFVNRGVQATSDSSEEHSSYEGSQSPNILRRSMSKISRQFSKSESLRDVIMHNDGVDDDAYNTVAEI